MKKILNFSLLIIITMAISCVKDQALDLCDKTEVSCNNLGQEFCQRIQQDEDFSFEVYSSDISANLLSDDDANFFFISGGSGTNTSVVADKLIDNTTDFTALGLDQGFTIRNITSQAQAWSGLASTTATEIETFIDPLTAPVAIQIFPNVGETYALLNWLLYSTVVSGNQPLWMDVVNNGEYGLYFFENNQIASKLSFFTNAGVGNAYKIKLTIKDYLSGNFQGVDFDNYVLDDDGNRIIEYSFYQPAANLTFISENNPDFILKKVEVFQITHVGIKILSGGSEVYSNELATNNGDANSPITYIDNYVKLTVNFDDLGLSSGCYTIVIYDADDDTDELESECLSVALHDCNLKLQWTNSHDIGEIRYKNGADYTQTMWVKGELKNSTWTLANDTYRTSNGDTLLLTARRERVYSLLIGDVPEHMHNAIASGMIHDTFTINGSQYRLASDVYEPIWRRTSNLAPSTTEVYLKQENFKNDLCG